MEVFMDVYPLVMTNIAMEDSPFIDGLPIKTSIILHSFIRDFPWLC